MAAETMQQAAPILARRAEELRETEPNFARFLLAAVQATEAADLDRWTAERFESLLRRAYTRLGKREGKSHILFDFPDPAGGPELVEIFSSDMPFIVDSVLAAIRAKGGGIRLMAHPVLHLDPESHRLLDVPAVGGINESLLLLELDPLDDEMQRDAILGEIDGTLTEVWRATRGWRGMLERLRRLVEEWKTNPPRATTVAIGEAREFLGWLAEHNFTFLGMREYRLDGTGAERRLTPLPASGIGILEDRNLRFLRAGTELVEMIPQHLAWLAEPDPIMVTKANIRTRVHRRAYMDYVGVKLYGADGEVTGELRIVGLFTSGAQATPNTDVPLIRRKLSEVLRRAGHAPASHAGKALMAALDAHPRDELFQIGQEQLFDFARSIAALADRPRLTVLPRLDRFDNFVSVLVYFPRDRYSSEVRAAAGAYLSRVYDGRISAYYPHFPESEMVRVHFIIGRDGGPTPRPEPAQLEAEIAELTLTFGDRLLRAAGGTADMRVWLDAFSPAYQSRNGAEDALADIAVIARLEGDTSLALKLAERQDGDGAYGLKIYHRGQPIPLSDRVPMLENFGFRVIDERTYTVEPEGGALCFIHDMVLDLPGGPVAEFAARAPLVEEAILAVWQLEAESDGLNRLVLAAGMGWTDVAILRALARYLKQIGVSWSRAYLAQVLNLHPEVARALVALFHAQLYPGQDGSRAQAAATARAAIAAGLDATQSLDEDRIIRRLHNLVEAALRSNAYQRDGEGRRRPALAIKFDCARIDGLPDPRPYREIFVYAPRVEGLHLRFGPIARGGLRWSDRQEDFRTEVLGLVKAQQVKNAIIVPVGAKGAFVPRLMPKGADRDTMQAEGTACYVIFVQSLLDITDNLDGENVVPPPDVLRRDGDDPYLVVAADKGTASFSDTANAIATAHGYWLGDAFASGGSHGYDHKQMGITARGAWEAVKRHFRELDRDIQKSLFTVVGVGDMSGDVFGNAMLLSPQIRLVAAFDHRDIFIDPDPDPAASLAERRRLFELPRSSWQDYDKQRLSKGGGIYPRHLKAVDLSPEARLRLGLGPEPVTPQEVISAILRAEVDLLWFGGIGTYLRGSDETDAAVGDRANDAIRITGGEVRALVVGEGANLAATQRARIEYAAKGGRIDTDAIDNSAGVNASDIEVNVKIALNSVLRAGALDFDRRNDVLVEMTDEVAALCLANNYLQTLALSLAQRAGLAALPDQRALIERLEAAGALDRAVEALPSDAELDARAAAGRGLTRPELAVLLAYAKIALTRELLDGGGLDGPELVPELERYFPPLLVERYPEAIATHRLRREVIATVLANQMVNRGGPGFVTRMMAATSADAGQVARAWCVLRDAYGIEPLLAAIDALDGAIAGATQLDLYAEIEALIGHECLWLLRNADLSRGIGRVTQHYVAGVAGIAKELPRLVPPGIAAGIATEAERLGAAGVPTELARRIAELGVLRLATDISLVAERASASITDAATAFFGVLELFGLAGIIDAAGGLVLADRFDRMALDRALANLMRAQRDLTADVLAYGSGSVATRLAAWRHSREVAITRAVEAVTALTTDQLSVSRLSVAAGLLSDLARSA